MCPLEQGLDRGTATPIWYNGNRMAIVVLPTERVLRLGIVVYYANSVSSTDVRSEMSLPIPWADASDLVEHLRKIIERWRPRRAFFISPSIPWACGGSKRALRWTTHAATARCASSAPCRKAYSGVRSARMNG